MRVGVVREVKVAERRVGLTPAGARELVAGGHEVIVEAGAGQGAAMPDAQYAEAGARLVESAVDVWAQAELLVKVKEPIESEYGRLREGLVLFAYLHLAADRLLTQALIESGTTAIAYETIEDGAGGLPLLAPMSEVAGRLAAQAAAYFLQAPLGGPGVLMGGVPGVAPARVTVIGGGVVGTHAARVAVGMGADVTVLERSPRRIRELEQLFATQARVLASDVMTVESMLARSDAVIGAVLIPGARAPRLVKRHQLAVMCPGAVLVDVAIDQGGCFETSSPTTHLEPTYVVDGIVHYCVANMPGAVPVTSTRALTNATLPYVLRLASDGVRRAVEDPCFAPGLNVRDGEVLSQPVHEALELEVAA